MWFHDILVSNIHGLTYVQIVVLHHDINCYVFTLVFGLKRFKVAVLIALIHRVTPGSEFCYTHLIGEEN